MDRCGAGNGDVGRLEREVAHLRAALVNRDMIGMAKGLLMCRTDCTADQAFGLLADQSQHQNVKVADVARGIVADHERRVGGPPAASGS